MTRNSMPSKWKDWAQIDTPNVDLGFETGDNMPICYPAIGSDGTVYVGSSDKK